MATNESKPFLCGVVEGFYGRPWTTEQRLDLFSCLSQWSLNCYLYAPKDDDKHRTGWRELYSLEEADHLAMLIKETRDHGIEFVYAIAPGLDITFSDDKEVTMLKRKIEQVSALGCNSFAVLFDDIDPDLSTKDAKVFSSAAQAQVNLTNEIYSFLGEPQIFLFCPTEYCGTRAVPNVRESPYLRYIGENLKPSIDIMWTGPKVISKTISLPSIEELIHVIQRRPVIWDNLHANDYDQRRLFLGPYQGRSTTLYSQLNGILTNPNCEYGANFVAIHTLAQWKKMGHSYNEKKVEAEGMEVILSEVSLYNPVDALEAALHDWISEFLTSKRKPENYQRPSKDVKSISRTNQEMELYDENKAPNNTNNGLMCEDDVCKDRSSSEGSSDMDTTPEVIIPPEQIAPTYSESLNSKISRFSLQDLRVIVDFFYLPHAHGEKGCFLLDEFTWLKQHACSHRLMQKAVSEEEEEKAAAEMNKRHDKMKDSTQSDGEDEEFYDPTSTDEMAEVQLWLNRAVRFHTFCEEVNRCFDNLTTIPNRQLLYDLYQYMSDARETTMLLDSYISWLEAGGVETHPKHQPHAKMGGIVAEMLKVLPDTAAPATTPTNTSRTFTIRPYKDSDKDLLYKTCLETGNDGDDGTLLFPNFPDLLGDMFVGPYLSYSTEFCYVVVDRDGACGYVLAALDSAQFYEQCKKEWLPQVCTKYPVPTKRETIEEQRLHEIQMPDFFLPDSLYRQYPSHLHIDLMKRAQDVGNGTHMMKLIMMLLKERGSCGVHLGMSSKNKKALKFYLKLGFEIIDVSSTSTDSLILGKLL